MHVDHLHGLELLEDGARCQSGDFCFSSLPQGHLQAVAQEADGNMRFDSVISRFLFPYCASILRRKSGNVVLSEVLPGITS